MPCRQCQHFLPSVKALAPRAGLAGYGYCKAAPDVVLRARLFPESQAACWLAESRYKKEFSE